MRRTKTNSTQANLPFERRDVWEKFPETVRTGVQKILAQMLTVAVAPKTQTGRDDER